MNLRWVEDSTLGNFVQEDIVQRLREQFHPFALFFWNGIDGGDVLVMWKPGAFLPRKLSILDCSARVPLMYGQQEPESGEFDLSIVNATSLLGRILKTCNGCATSFEML